MFWKTAVWTLFVVGVFADMIDRPTQHARNMCEKVKAKDKEDDVATALQAFNNCTSELGIPEQLHKDIVDAMPNGTATITPVLKNYTAKSSQLKTCVHNLFDGVKPCLDKGAQELVAYYKNATDQIIDFVSYNDGERVATLFSEQGFQCYNGRNIQRCMSYSRITTPANTVDPAIGLSISDRCSYYDAMYNCTLNSLNGCTNPTLRNLVELLYTSLRKSSPCNDALPVTTLSTKN